MEETDRQAEELLDRLTKQLAEREGVTEALKAENQMEWVRRMNNIRSRAEDDERAGVARLSWGVSGK